METEMNGIIARLTAPGMPGIKGLLVDSDVRARWLEGGRLDLVF